MKQKRKSKTAVGIWGFGIVGKSALHYFKSKNCTVEIFDAQPISKKNKTLIADSNASITHDLDLFLQKNDQILASPGIDVYPYKKYKHKWITELDLIQLNFHKPIIAITGTVGKTTVTHMLSQLLKNSGLKVFTGGNIGTGMLELLNEKHKDNDCAILEASSFQLEQCKEFAPDVAIWTNFSSNHLDRHKTAEQYFQAKKKIFQRQKKEHHAILPLEVAHQKSTFGEIKSTLLFFSKMLKQSYSLFPLFTIKGGSVMRHNNKKKPLVCNKNIQEVFKSVTNASFEENGLIVAAAAQILEQLFGKTFLFTQPVTPLPPHRLEYVAAMNGVTFYNDSKSTTPTATVAAVQKCSVKPILLLLGGLSKGADRAPMLKQIKSQVKKIYAFGAERTKIQECCEQLNIVCSSLTTLKKAFEQTLAEARPNDLVLLSPAGASFDLFNNYKERGDFFKKLVAECERK